ncbi:MAG: hypothetical protein OXU42_08650 [Deltaproteobacteria bacterium]|nr:hypothetical protein [Deltaproteobacteria bacterium]
MVSKIPSWAVGLTGALIAIIATITSATLLHQTRTRITAATSEVAEMRNRSDTLWSSHRLADQRSTAADVFLAMALAQRSDTEALPVLLQQTAAQLQGAVLAMSAASGEAVPDEPPEEIQRLYAALLAGDLNGYASLRAEIDERRLLSQSTINQLASDVGSTELRIDSLRARESTLYLAYVFLNLLGLMVTMCKDLPVWKPTVFPRCHSQPPAGTTSTPAVPTDPAARVVTDRAAP